MGRELAAEAARLDLIDEYAASFPKARDTQAMGQVMFGGLLSLIGVVIGGMVTGSIQAERDRRTQEIGTQAAARLVGHELTVMGAHIEAAACGEGPGEVLGRLRWAVDSGFMQANAWAKHQQTLAEVLLPEEWETLADTYFSISIACAPEGEDPDADARNIGQVIWSQEVEMAFDALGPYLDARQSEPRLSLTRWRRAGIWLAWLVRGQAGRRCGHR